MNILMYHHSKMDRFSFKDTFTENGYKITNVNSIENLNLIFKNKSIDVIIVEENASPSKTMEDCMIIREKIGFFPVILISYNLTLSVDIMDIYNVVSDFILYPFRLDELTTRLKSAYHKFYRSDMILRYSNMKIDLLKRKFTIENNIIHLLPKEYKILEYMMKRPEKIVTREELFHNVWNLNNSPNSKSIDVHISNIRKKIDVNKNNTKIKCVKNVGFILSDI